jgi:hypothetical protein
MIVAVARKLLIVLWRMAITGAAAAGIALRPAAKRPQAAEVELKLSATRVANFEMKMTSRGGGNPIVDMVFEPRFTVGPPPRSFAADAHDCIMVSILAGRPNTSLRREDRA